MRRVSTRLSAGLLAAVLLLGPLALPRAAAAGVTFTVLVKSAFLRASPSFNAPRLYSVFKDQAFAVVGRDPTSAWVQLDYPGAVDGGTWIHVSYGRVSGSLTDLPVSGTSAAAPASTPPPAARASGAASPSASYTVVARSLFARNLPDARGARVFSLFKGQVYPIIARSADLAWVRLLVEQGIEAWAPVGAGAVSGGLDGLPVGGALFPTALPPPPPGPALPGVSQRARDIYRAGLGLGNNPRAFSKIGDCNSVPPYFLAPFDRPAEYRLGAQNAYLQETINNFAGSFARESLAAKDGMNTTSVFDPVWARPGVCLRGETPLACELRVQRPSIAFISLGTNGSWQSDAEYEGNLRRILDALVEHGVVPILSTKADDLEGGSRFNHIVQRLAGEYDVPLWDYAQVAQALPGRGLSDSYHPSLGANYFDTPANLSLGWPLRNLTALQALDAVWKATR
jgi:hypothetical protein